MNYVTYAVPFFVLAVACEFLFGWLRNRNTFTLADTLNSLQLGMLSRLRGLIQLANDPVMAQDVTIQTARQMGQGDTFRQPYLCRDEDVKVICKLCGGRPHHLARGQSPRCIPGSIHEQNLQ